MAGGEAARAVTLPIYSCRLDLPLQLPPSWLSSPLEGVREQLNRAVLRYVDHLDGVLLSYSGLRLRAPLGRICNDLPEVHVRAALRATYFAPRVGDRLEATVSRIGSDHLALLILGVFNASVPLPTGGGRSVPRPDEKVQFIVSSVRHADGLLSVHGDLCEPRGEIGAPEPAARSAEGAGGARKGAKRRRTGAEVETS